MAIIPPMAFVVIYGSKVVSRYAKSAQEHTAKANSVAEGAINAVPVVQAFGAIDVLANEHLRLMGPAVGDGVRKSIFGSLMLGAVFFIAYAILSW